MYHDLEKGLIYLSDEELLRLGEIRSPVDERVVPYMLRSIEVSERMLPEVIEQSRRILEAGIPTEVPQEVVIERLLASLKELEILKPLVEKIALDVEFKWRGAGF